MTAATAIDSPVVTCNCFYADQSWHDALLEMEGHAGIVGDLRSDLVEGHGRWGDDGAEWGDIAVFIREHHWQDQPGMNQLAELFRFIEEATR